MRSRFLLCVVAGAAICEAQVSGPALSTDTPASSRSAYVLGPDDQIAVRALDAEEIGDKPMRIETNGDIRLPLVGQFKAAGLTAAQLEAEIAARLREFVKNPQVSVAVLEFRSQPVSVIGSVKNPGVHQLQGRKTLVEILSLAGGVGQDAGHSVKITRKLDFGKIPLASAQNDPTGQFSIAQISLKGIVAATNPEENILIQPYDVISVPRAEMVYVTGQVTRSGGFVLNERETLSVLQAVSLAGGLDKTAAPQNARILRARAANADRQELAVNLKKILEGKADDLPLQPEDILFVPSSGTKRIALRAAEAAIQMGTGLVIWRR